MTQNITTKEQAIKSINQIRCVVITVWFFAMSFIGTFNNETIAGITGVAVTLCCIFLFSGEKKKIMAQMNAMPSTPVTGTSPHIANPIISSTEEQNEQPQVAIKENTARKFMTSENIKGGLFAVTITGVIYIVGGESGVRLVFSFILWGLLITGVIILLKKIY